MIPVSPYSHHTATPITDPAITATMALAGYATTSVATILASYVTISIAIIATDTQPHCKGI